MAPTSLAPNAPPSGPARDPMENNSRASSASRRSVQFNSQALSSSPSRKSQSVDAEPMSPGHHSSETEDSESEIRPIASLGQARNYNTASGPAVSRRPSQQQTTKSRSPSPEKSRFGRWAEKYGTIELENKGSVARDHLALERTFLAWLRTSLAFASIGIAITQLFRLNTSLASKNGGSSRRLEYSPYLGHTIPYPDNDPPYIQEDQSILALLTSPYPNAIPSDTAKHLRQIGKPLGATFLGVSILILFIGFHRYFESQYWIIHGKFPASRSSVAIVAFVTMALIVASLIVVLAVAGGSFEK